MSAWANWSRSLAKNSATWRILSWFPFVPALRASMPGMMDTILNLGLNDEVVEVMAKKTGNPRFAYDSYRRFIQMYSDVVMEVGKAYFEEAHRRDEREKGR